MIPSGQESSQNQPYLDLLEKVMAEIKNEMRFDEVTSHSSMVGELCQQFAASFSDVDPEIAFIAGTLHDIGRATPEALFITNNGRKLTPAERKEMQKHPEATYQMVKELGFPDEICQAVYQHHEEWDGSGYPQGLQGEAINMYARLIHLMDNFCAHMEVRSYKNALTPEKAKDEILKEFDQDKHDPALKKPFLLFYYENFI